ncbi:MAG TPA: ECF transporter S component [Candidatus Limnocylindria bacterium]|nr:ECF transporter S component [Candidatus Limnocylindria bacterium]
MGGQVGRVLIGVGGAVVAFVVGLLATGTFDNRLDDNGIAGGARTVTVLAIVAAVAGTAMYAAAEWVQTRQIESIARQFGTRTLVMMPLAIALNVILGQTVASALKVPIYLDSIGTILVGVLCGPLAGAATGILANLAWTFLFAGTPFGSPYAWPFAVVAGEIGFVAGLVGYAGLLRPRPNTPLPRLLAGLAAAAAFVIGVAWFAVLPFYRGLCEVADGGTVADSPCFQLFSPGLSGLAPVFAFLAVVVLAVIALGVAGFVLRVLRDRDLGVVFAVVAGAACGVISALIAAPIAVLVFGGVTGSGTDLLVLAFTQAGSDLQTAVVQQALLSDTIDKSITYLIVFVVLASASRRIVARFPQGERAVGTIDA